MKAIIRTKYGPPDILELKDVEQPVPQDDEVLIKIHAAALNAYDWRILRAKPFFIRLMGFGLFKPKHKILGADVAGIVESIGCNVKQFKPGDEIYGDTSSCGNGAFAEYLCAPEKYLALKPSVLTFEEAAAVPFAAGTSLMGLRDSGKIKQGQKVLINGASGGVGTFAVQIAKSFDTEVTAVCSPGNLERMHELGADHVIDYTKENFTKSGKTYDLIFAANGYHPIFDYKRALNPGGHYVVSGGTMKQVTEVGFIGPWISMTGSRKMCTFVNIPNKKDLNIIKELIEAGKVKPVIDRTYPLSETADAIRYLEEGHARGKVVISV